MVHFDEEDCVACIPKKKMMSPNLPGIGDACTVRWSDGNDYAATVVAMGKCVCVCVFVCVRARYYSAK